MRNTLIADHVKRPCHWGVLWEAPVGDLRVGRLPLVGHHVSTENLEGKRVRLTASRFRSGDFGSHSTADEVLTCDVGSVQSAQLSASRYAGSLVGRAVMGGYIRVEDIFPFTTAGLIEVCPDAYMSGTSWTQDILYTAFLAASGVSLSWAEAFLCRLRGHRGIPDAWHLYDLRRRYKGMGLLLNMQEKAADLYLRLAAGQASETVAADMKQTVASFSAMEEDVCRARGIPCPGPREYVQRASWDAVWIRAVPSPVADTAPAADESAYGSSEVGDGKPAEVSVDSARLTAAEARLPEVDPSSRAVEHRIVVDMPAVRDLQDDVRHLTTVVTDLNNEIQALKAMLSVRLVRDDIRVTVSPVF